MLVGSLLTAMEDVLEKQPTAQTGGFQEGPLAPSTWTKGDRDPGSKLTLPPAEFQPEGWPLGFGVWEAHQLGLDSGCSEGSRTAQGREAVGA